MILEHEIPQGSKLYFKESARLKRSIENRASEILCANGFEEILTPIFSYHQPSSIADTKELIRINDQKNSLLSLRADSTLDVVRLILKRLGRNTEHKKWFYIQAVYRYPTEEQYQIGVEYIDSKDLWLVLKLCVQIFKSLDFEPFVHISNMKIPKILTNMFSDLDLDDFRHTNIEKFLNYNIEWLSKLVYMQNIEQLNELLEIAPSDIKEELLKLKELHGSIEYKNTLISPLYYADMLYYDELYFRFIEKNDILASGGSYNNLDVDSVGFAIYSDALIEKMSKGNYNES